MTDQKFTELLSEKLSGEISPGDDQVFMQMLADNEVYRNEYEALSVYFNAAEEPDDQIRVRFEKIKERILPLGVETIPEPAVERVSRPLNFWYRAAAVFMLGICAFAAYRFLGKERGAGDGTTIVWNKMISTGKNRSLVLKDGTKVTLNKGTEIKYAATFKGETRDVYLTGEAFFDVAEDHAHPFIVHTKTINVKVLGTAFDVKSYADEPFTETTLLRGKIDITLNNGSGKHTLLSPQQKFTLKHAADPAPEQLNDDAARVSVMTYYRDGGSDAVLETSWMKGQLLFRNEAFSLLSLRMARWYGVNFVFKTEGLEAVEFTGQFEKESLPQALSALQLITPFDYKIQGKTVYLYPAK